MTAVLLFFPRFVAASVPALVGLIVTPYLVYKLLPPEIKETPDAPAIADERLKEMGPPSSQEKLMVREVGPSVASESIALESFDAITIIHRF